MAESAISLNSRGGSARVGSRMVAKIHHVGIVVESLEQAYRFWRQTLGMPLLREAELSDQGVRAALLAAGDSEIELLEPILEHGVGSEDIGDRHRAIARRGPPALPEVAPEARADLGIGHHVTRGHRHARKVLGHRADPDRAGGPAVGLPVPARWR